jgi:AraC-like DNA-binding protein
MDVQQEMIRYDRVRHINVEVRKVHFLKEHVHGSFELSYVLKGSAQCHQSQEARTICPGDLILTNPYEPHSYVAQGEESLVLLTVQIHKLFARRYVEIIPRLIFQSGQITRLTQSQYDTVVKLIFQTAIAYLGNRRSQQFDVIGYVIILLGKLVEYLDWRLENNPDNSDKELQKNRVQRLVSYIDENYRQKITLSMLAEMEGISTTYLSHFFRKTFGVSFQNYLSAQRFEKALVLMHDKSISMVDICMNCGFSDSRYLEAACRRTFGCSVYEYRKRLESQEECEIAQGSDVLHKRCSRKDSLELLKEYLGPETFETLS